MFRRQIFEGQYTNGKVEKEIEKHILVPTIKQEESPLTFKSPSLHCHFLIQELNTMHNDPIAIVGIGCRFPGKASDPQKFWNLLLEGGNGIGKVPKERWDLRRFFNQDPAIPGKTYVDQGGFLSESWEAFDAEFFHISPREAPHMDPQQRLLLELTWEALEDGGIIPDSLSQSNAGVFIGASVMDWQNLCASPSNIPHYSSFSAINGSQTVLSARLSYFLNLTGPCFTVDTACSSSLVAAHLGCQSLWNQECSLAIVGGVNAMLAPLSTILMSKGRFLNPEGYCRPFSAQAKGYIRGEGGGIVILKRLSDAVRDGNVIYALIRGTGINQDGATNGISQPSADQQFSLIHKVLNESGVAPSDIHYVEAHGTGTPVGDPIEAEALQRALSGSCLLGALKSNIGHLEAAAGVAGLIKTALCLKHRKVPPNLHCEELNPHISFDKLKIPSQIEELPEGPLFAGVNSFGFGGTNAHAILQSYTADQSEKGKSEDLYLIPYSAKNEEALKQMAKVHAEFLTGEMEIADIAYTLTHKRNRFDHRLVVSARTAKELKEKLAQEELPPGCFRGKVQEGKLAFVYTGMGPQWEGMGIELFATSPVFKEIVLQCDQFLQSLSGWSLLDPALSIEDPQVAQVSNFVLQAGLTAVFKERGIEPDAVVGHSIGEVAAVYAAGGLTLEEGVFVSFHRSRIQSLRKNQGTMLAVGLSSEAAEAYINDKVSIAAVNSPHSVTLAGEKEALEAIAESLEKENIFNRFLRVNIAYHSHQMNGLEEEVLKAFKTLEGKKCKLPFYSTVYADENSERQYNALYWWKNIREPVLFAKTLQSMIQEGYRLFVEIGPHPVLASFIKEMKGEPIASLKRMKGEWDTLAECWGALYCYGRPVQWNQSGRFMQLPTYPWLKKHHWIESEESREFRLGRKGHAMLNRKVESPVPTWQTEANTQFFPWLNDHQIEGSVIFPAAAYVEAGLALHGTLPCALENLDFVHPLTVEQPKTVQLTFEGNVYKIHSLDQGKWNYHATGKCVPFEGAPPVYDLKLEGEERDAQAVYARFASMGLEYGPFFRGIQRFWRRENEVLSEIATAPGAHDLLYPPILDCAFQTVIGMVEGEEPGLVLPQHIDKVIVHASPKGKVYCLAKGLKVTKEKITSDLLLIEEGGTVAAEIKGFQCKLLEKRASHTLYNFVWEESAIETEARHEPHQVFFAKEEDEIETVSALVNLVKGIEEAATLWVVTQRTQAVLPDDAVRYEGSSLWGLVRVLKQEIPHIRFRMVDVDDDADYISLEGGTAEDEIAWRKGKRYVLKLKPYAFPENKIPLSHFTLDQKRAGLIENLYFRQIENDPPLPGQVGIKIHSTSLNFKDLMKVLGMLGQNVLENTYFGNDLGMECSGTIVALGKGVKGYKIGDRVCAFSPNTFRTYVNVPAQCIHKIPPHSPIGEAPIYIPYITALRALKQIANLKKGETVLIHSATGAVGLAAIQYAQSVGAKIIATAGSEEKRAYLRSLGVLRCSDSRSLDFVQDVMTWTEGRGVDVVLNSLGGEALIQSWSLLAPHGRFVEIGKRDIGMNSPLPMKYFNRNTSFTALDLDQIEELGQSLKKLLQDTDLLFQKGVFKLIPCKLFSASDAVEAFQYMARAKHIGKIVLNFNEETVEGLPHPIRSDCSYLITGGLRGFGFNTAKWLVQRGAKHLILLGRSERPLEDLGVNVKVGIVDVADAKRLKAFLAECKKEMPPIRGVFHSAMVLRDSLSCDLTEESVREVLMPKVAGCLNLHRLTLQQPLDFFVLYSSISSLIGNVGQSSYAAANAFLDAFCHYRRSLGLHGLTINWGALNAGVLERNALVAKHLEIHGIKRLSNRHAFQILEEALIHNATQFAALDVNWKKLGGTMTPLKSSSVFSYIYQNEERGRSRGAIDVNEMISNIKEIVAKTLKIDAQTLDVTLSLKKMGIDSLMAMELQTIIEQKYGFTIPTIELMRGPSIAELAEIAMGLESATA